MYLNKYSSKDFSRGRSRGVELLWLMISGFFISSWLPGSSWRVFTLSIFGARIGRSVVIKPGLVVKFPWRLSVGDHSWLGERLWVDNLGEVVIHSNVCISQGVYLCTGSHDWAEEKFDLIVRPIEIKSHAWICAMAVIGPGVCINEGAIVALGAIAVKDVLPWMIYQRDGSGKLRNTRL